MHPELNVELKTWVASAAYKGIKGAAGKLSQESGPHLLFLGKRSADLTQEISNLINPLGFLGSTRTKESGWLAVVPDGHSRLEERVPAERRLKSNPES